MLGSGNTTWITLNEKMNDIMKLVKSLEVSGLLIESISQTVENEVKEPHIYFLECY